MVKLLALLAALTCAYAEESVHHHDGESAVVDEFYSTWAMPDHPTQSCCNKLDCYSPARVEFKDGFWWFERREDHKMVRVPPEKVELNRDNPDGRNHVCAGGPAEYANVFCFIVGGGL